MAHAPKARTLLNTQKANFFNGDTFSREPAFKTAEVHEETSQTHTP